jgi:hypothetical protein
MPIIPLSPSVRATFPIHFPKYFANCFLTAKIEFWWVYPLPAHQGVSLPPYSNFDCPQSIVFPSPCIVLFLTTLLICVDQQPWSLDLVAVQITDPPFLGTSSSDYSASLTLCKGNTLRSPTIPYEHPRIRLNICEHVWTSANNFVNVRITSQAREPFHKLSNIFGPIE